MAQGFRSVLLPPQMEAFEPGGSWEHWRIFLVLTAWTVGGLIACLTVFWWWSDTK
jgi:ABC-2 type transport system permease protein